MYNLNGGVWLIMATKDEFLNKENNINTNKEDFLKKNIVVAAGAFICCLLWGSAFPCIKLGYGFSGIAASDTASQILYAGVRFTLAGIFTIIIGSLASRKLLVPKKEAVPKILWLCILQTVLQYAFFYIGLARTTGVKASIIEAVNVFVAIFVSALLFRQEKLTARKLLGSLVGFAGVVLINVIGGSDGLGGFTFFGDGFIFLSTVSYAFSSVYLKKYSKTESPVMMSGYQFVMGGIIMAVAGFAMGGEFSLGTTNSILMLVYLGLVSAIAYSLWGILLKHNEVSKVAVFGFMNPMFGAILSYLLLDEGARFGLLSMTSLVLVCIGIFICNRKKKADS